MNMGGMVSQVHVPNAVMHLTMGVIDMAAGFLHSVSLKTFPPDPPHKRASHSLAMMGQSHAHSIIVCHQGENSTLLVGLLEHHDAKRAEQQR